MKNSLKLIIPLFLFLFGSKCYSQAISLGSDENTVYNTLYDRVRSYNNSQNSNGLQKFNVKHIDGVVSEIIISIKDGYLYDLGVNSDFSIHYIMEDGYLHHISTHYENVSLMRLKSSFEKQYGEKNISNYYFSDDYKNYKIIVLDNNGLATVEERKTLTGNFPQTVRSSLVKLGILGNNNTASFNSNALNNSAESNFNSKAFTSYCNEGIVYALKVTGRNVTIHCTDLNHLDRSYTDNGYIEKGKIYIKTSPKSAKYVWEFILNEKHQLSMFDNNKKQWVIIEPCETPINTSAVYKYPNAKTGGNSDGNQGEPVGNATEDKNNQVIGNQGASIVNTTEDKKTQVIVGLLQRSFANRPTIGNDEHVTGRVVVKLTVNRNGDIIFVHAGEKGTTITDPIILKKCEDAVKRSKINSSNEASDHQDGLVLFIFKTI
ncbi:hypothetical protein [Mucilaginibacter antarcticus]|uniref:TonB-like protein n=1 Tax=Mucilaginibacter antarcticus TaxID=1855725 RepID=A0ABW5XMN6_9SPHI